ncbi:MAG: pyridoxal phosphate-dependent aminotransferase, partial [Bacteroidetes bacterium]|nr:pyridoxal phosphate-dependent aminotransferase [Bacteroidota bacterium]
MGKTPVSASVVEEKIAALEIEGIGDASIREIVQLVSSIEAATGTKYVRMEMGVPGLPPSKVGVEAEIKALQNNVASIYPQIDGIPELKREAARFVKLFLNIAVKPEGCVPTVGSMEGSYAAFLVTGVCRKERDTALFIDPGFPVQKQQMMVMNQKFLSFDIFEFRGDQLRDKLESYLSKGNICNIIYSNPNNPAWTCLTEEELKIIGSVHRIAKTVVIEDLAYFAMDFRQDLSKPGIPPYQPTVARYTSNWVMMISSSKVFSYAGQRIGVLIISDQLYHRHFPNLNDRLHVHGFGNAIVHRVLYSMTSGTAHSSQYALAAMFQHANDGDYNFVGEVKEYGEKARIVGI